MISLKVVLMVIAFVLLLMSGLGVQAPRVNLQSMGLALWALAIIIS
jgi:hypothetical protein